MVFLWTILPSTVDLKLLWIELCAWPLKKKKINSKHGGNILGYPKLKSPQLK